MENTNQKPVVTLKAEFVNEFEFTPRSERVGRFSDETKIVHPYQSNYEAKVAVKIGNAVKNLIFKENDHYVPSFYREDGTYVSGTSFMFLGLTEKSNPFEELENAGIAVDYFHIQLQYQKMVKEAKYQETLIRRYEIWVNIRKAKKSLKDSWIHKFEGTIKADNNKNIKAALKLTTFGISKKYDGKHNIKVTYKDITVPIHMIDGSFAFNNEQYEYNMDPFITNENGEKKNVKIANNRLRKAKKEGTLFLKAIEAIDVYLNDIDYKKNARKEELSETEEKRTYLEKVLGHKVCVTEERKYSRDRHSNHSWLEKNYFLLMEQPKDRWEKGTRISINYYDHYKTFGIKGLDNLNEKQFKSIVEILIDGRKVLPKLIVPKEKA